MSEAFRLFGIAWVLTQVCSLTMLRVGARLGGHKYLLRLGEISHQQKLRALDVFWPLTRLRPAAERGDIGTATLILGSLIILKSVASLVFGILMVFWLPAASLLVPAIVAVHDPNDPTLSAWVNKVAALQVTSHTVAAALGFALVLTTLRSGVSIQTVTAENGTLFVVASLASVVLAIAAGRLEAAGVIERGI